MFDITEEMYRVGTVEVLSTIEIDHHLTSFDRAGSIRFQLFSVQHTLSYIDYAMFLGLYDSEFVMTAENDRLHIDYPRGEIAYRVWRCFCSGRNYEPCLMKASCIINPTLWYIHTVIARSFTDKVDSQGVVGKQ